MRFILENAVAVGLTGTVLSGLIGFAGLKLSERRAIYAAMLLMCITGLLVAVSLWIDTDREQIQRAMREIAQAVRENDHQKIYTYFHPNASTGISHARTEIPRYTFHQARISNVREILVNESTRPPSAISEFLAAMRVSSQTSDLQGAEIPVRRWVKVYWMKQGDRWLVRDYEHYEMMHGFTNQPPS